MDPVVVVGFGVGALGAVRTILSNSREPDIIVIERRGFDTYSPCGMPYVIGGEVASHDLLKHDFPPNRRLTVRRKTEALAIDPAGKTVRVRSIETGEEEDITYSSLILDTGSKPFIPSIPFEKSLLKKGIYTLTTPADVELLEDALSGLEKVAVIGAGAIGLEMAQALDGRGKKVVLVEMADHPISASFDNDLAQLAIEALPDPIETLFSIPIEGIGGKEKVEDILAGGKRIPVDAVLLCMGAVPETSLARSAGLATSELGIVVDDTMHTSNPFIYAIGDCIQNKCRITKVPMATRIAVPSLLQGKIAGLNIAGKETGYHGSTGAFATMIGGIQFAAAGLRASALENDVSAKVSVKIRPGYMGDEEVTVKLVADGAGKLVGIQAAGENAVGLVNRGALAIAKGVTAGELALMDTAYCPPVSDVFDPLATAAEIMMKKLERRKER